MKKLSLICVALLLSACGGESYKAQAMLPAPPAPEVPPPPVVVTPPPAPAVDAYYTTVRTTVAAELDLVEPTSLDAFVSTMPEDTEPTAVF